MISFQENSTLCFRVNAQTYNVQHGAVELKQTFFSNGIAWQEIIGVSFASSLLFYMYSLCFFPFGVSG